MPSFDVVSEVDWQEVRNALDQANREISNRFDFKGSGARVEQDGARRERLTVFADDEFKVGQARDILENKLARRKVDLNCLRRDAVREAGGKAQQDITVRHGIDGDLARKLVKAIKAAKLKVQAAIQGDRIRVSGKKRDDLQSVLAVLKEQKSDVPLQFINFRD